MDKLLTRIGKERAEMARAAVSLFGPLHTVDRMRDRTHRYGHWIYPVAPVALLAVARLRPRATTMLSLATRGFGAWRAVQQVKQMRGL